MKAQKQFLGNIKSTAKALKSMVKQSFGPNKTKTIYLSRRHFNKHLKDARNAKRMGTT